MLSLNRLRPLTRPLLLRSQHVIMGVAPRRGLTHSSFPSRDVDSDTSSSSAGWSEGPRSWRTPPGRHALPEEMEDLNETTETRSMNTPEAAPEPRWVRAPPGRGALLEELESDQAQPNDQVMADSSSTVPVKDESIVAGAEMNSSRGYTPPQMGQPANRSSSTLTHNRVPTNVNSKFFHTRAPVGWAPMLNNESKEELKDEAHRMKSRAKTNLKKVKHEVQDAAGELKEGLADAWSSTKAEAKKFKKKVEEKVEEMIEPTSAPRDTSSMSSSSGMKDRSDTSIPVTGVYSSLGQDQDSVSKSFINGPQEMPMGVGKRAKDEHGNPMETGARGT